MAHDEPAPVSEEAAHAIAVDAYLYFCPLLAMNLTRKQSTNFEQGREFGKGPMNMWILTSRLSSHAF